MRQFSLAILTLAVIAPSLSAAEPEPPKPPEPTAEHKFLKRFSGEWECTTEGFFDPENPITTKGVMSGKMIGEYWAVITVTADHGGDQPYVGRGTFGFDSLKTKKCFGTWTDSMSPFLWKYEGRVDGNKLVLDSEGPDPADPKKMVKARDTWEFKSRDLIVLTGEWTGSDGKLVVLMKSTCRRKNAAKKKQK